MARKRDPRRDEAFELFKKHKGDITNRSIAEQLNVPEKTISAWKSRDKWNAVLQNNECSTTIEECSTTKRKGAPAGNKNAVGNKGGGAPKGNKNAVGHGAPLRNDNAVTHGFFRKYLPPAAMDIIEQMRESDLKMLDLLWMSIEMKFATIMHSHKIMFVESKDELIKEIKKQKFEVIPNKDGFEQVPVETELEFQWAWDRQATFVNAQSRAMAELRNLFKDYMVHSGEDDKRRLEIERMKKELEKTNIELEILKEGDNKEVTELVVRRWSKDAADS